MRMVKQRKTDWTMLVMLGIAIALTCNLVGCEGFFEISKQETIGDIITKQESESRQVWVRVPGETGGTGGGRVWISQNVIALADGSRVVCVSTFDALWCKEAKTE